MNNRLALVALLSCNIDVGGEREKNPNHVFVHLPFLNSALF